MTKTTTYAGACHCGKVRFEVHGALDQASTCNCSICRRVGWLMASVESARFKLLAGEDAQSDYQFGGKTMHHLFCKTCGIHAYGTFMHEGTSKVIVNLHCIDGFDSKGLEVKEFDGASY